MSWYMLSRRVRDLHCSFKKIQVAGSVVRTYSPCTSRHVERYRPSIESRRHYGSIVVQEKKSWKKLMYTTALVFGMVGCSFAAAPIYQMFCQIAGSGSTGQHHDEIVEEKEHSRDGIATTREIVVQFNVDAADGMPWKFVPMQREVMVKPGESSLAFYTVENQSSTSIVGMPTYNITPPEAAVYFKCFCLEEQRLQPGQEVEMPVFFQIDPELEKDSKLNDINSLILSYAFVKVPKENN